MASQNTTNTENGPKKETQEILSLSLGKFIREMDVRVRKIRGHIFKGDGRDNMIYYNRFHALRKETLLPQCQKFHLYYYMYAFPPTARETLLKQVEADEAIFPEARARWIKARKKMGQNKKWEEK